MSRARDETTTTYDPLMSLKQAETDESIAFTPRRIRDACGHVHSHELRSETVPIGAAAQPHASAASEAFRDINTSFLQTCPLI